MTAVTEPSYRRRIGYQAGLLGGFTLLATTFLVMGNLATQEAIEQCHQEDLRASLAQVIPAARHDNDLLAAALTLTGPDAEPRTVYRARQDGVITAVAYQVSGPGYGGPIEILLGLDRRGRILGARVLSHSETPGLGDKIEAARSDWIREFTGLSLGEPPARQWAVQKDGGRFDQFTGATITPRAVVNAIKGGLQWFADQRQHLLNDFAEAS